MRFPISVQNFEELRREGYMYVDKTDLIYNLVNNYKAVFLGRPRMFGKSLLVSTIHEYFLGHRYLFEGLAIETKENVWKEHPVLHMDFTCGNFSSVQGLLNLLNDELMYLEKKFLYKTYDDPEPHLRLKRLIKVASSRNQGLPVVLIEDYDKPLYRTMFKPGLEEAFSEILRPFFGVLKSESHLLRFVMLTGKSSCSKFSVLNDFNNIVDISLNPDFAEICGFTDDELNRTFHEQIMAFAQMRDTTKERIVKDLINYYGGFRFSEADKHVCNPSSVIRCLKNQVLSEYWYECATPSFLKIFLANNPCPRSKIYSAEKYEDALYQVEPPDVISLLYQTGYLTIKDFDKLNKKCKLYFPNHEVRSSYFKFLLSLMGL